MLQMIFQQLLGVQFTWIFRHDFKVDWNTMSKRFQGSISSGAGFKGQKLFSSVVDPVINFSYVYINQALLKFNMKVYYRWYYSILVSLIFSKICFNRDMFQGAILFVSDFAIHSFICASQTNFTEILHKSSLSMVIYYLIISIILYRKVQASGAKKSNSQI